MRGVRGSATYEHGTENCYVNGHCRLPECRKAASRARKIRRLVTKDQAIPMRVPAIGSMRRLQALMTLGWSLPRLEVEAGVREWYYRTLMFVRPATLDRDRAERISQLYDSLWDQEPPQTTYAERFSASFSKTAARRNGWAPPMAWALIDIDDPDAVPRLDAVLDEDEIFDWVKVDRVVAGTGNPKELTTAEKVAAARRLMAGGLPLHRTADRLHMGPGTLKDRLKEDAPLAA